MADTIQTLAVALASALRPLAETLGAADDDIAALVEDLGYILPSVPPSLSSLNAVSEPMLASLEDVEQAQLALEDGTGSENDLLIAIGVLLADVGLVAGRIAALRSALPGELPAPFVAATNIADDLPTRLYDYLIIQSMEAGAALAAHILMFLGVLEVIETDADPARHQPAFELHRIRWDRIPQVFEDPPGIFRDVYGWGTPDLDVERLFEATSDLALDFLAPAEITYPEDSTLQALGAAGLVDPADGPDPELEIPFFLSDEVTLSLVLFALPQASPTEPRGLAATLRASGDISIEIPLSDRLAMEISAGADLEAGVAAVVRPNQPIALVENVSGGGASSVLKSARVAVKLSYGSLTEGEPPVTLLSFPGGSRVEARQVSIAIAAEATGAGQASLGVEGGIAGGKVVLAMDQADSFLSSLLPADGLEAQFDFLIGWSSSRGVYFQGSASLETTIPLHTTLGPLTLDSLHLGLGVGADGLQLEVSITGGATIGPIAAAIERIGVLGNLAFSGGNLGPVDLGLAFKFPTGLGLAIDAGPVTGGGFLSFDPPNGRYAGILHLEMYGIGVTAIGLLDTQDPNGEALPAPGFSFLIIVAVRFPPIQLGYGFTLNAVGGLAGIHRTIVTQALQDGIRAGSVDHIMFPDDPVRNAPQIISDLRAIFPPAPNRFIFGPMLIIGWGTPTLIEAEIGLILELPDPIRIIFLGQLNIALPTREAAIVSLHMDILGILDFAQQQLSIDATLRDSYIAAFAISGDMALRLGWGDEPNFALSIGGLNPHFQPPPNFPALRRVTVSLGMGDNPRISLQAYVAITSNSLQFGAKAELYAEGGGFNIYGWIGFDALVVFSPFYFRADLSAGVALRRGTSTIAGIHVSATLTGPSPYHVWGEGCISLLFFDVCVGFDATFGESRAVELPAKDPWPELEAAIGDVRNWSASLPPTVDSAVTIQEPGSEDLPLLVHPMGTATLRQKVVPLNRAIAKFGEFEIEGASRFDVGSVMIGDDPAASWEPVEDFFAPGQFENLSDDQKLSRPSFEKMVAGIGVGSRHVEHGAAKTAKVVYETRIVDSPWDSRPAPFFTLLLDHQIALSFTGAKARSPLATTGSSKFAAPLGRAKGFALDDEDYVIATTDDLSVRAEFGRMAPGAAFQALDAHLAAHPEDRGRLQVVPAYEAEGSA